MGEGIELVTSLKFDELVWDTQPVSNNTIPAINKDAFLLFLNLIIPHPEHS